MIDFIFNKEKTDLDPKIKLTDILRKLPNMLSNIRIASRLLNFINPKMITVNLFLMNIPILMHN